MKLFKLFGGSRFRIIAIVILILFVLFLFLPDFFFKTYQVIPLFSSLGDFYLLPAEKLANMLLGLAGSAVSIDNHQVVSDQIILTGFIPQIYFKKWMILFLIFIWITRTTYLRKALISALLIIVHFIVISAYLATGAYLASSFNKDYALLSLPLTSGILLLFSIVFIWYRKHKDVLLPGLSRLNLNSKIIRSDFHVFMAAFIYIVISYFLLEFFEYELWIDFLFTTSQKILALAGYNAIVEPFYLIGEKGSIFMLKSCLGSQTMLLFAIIVYVTGNTTWKMRWLYIVSGILFLNIVNIMRFVFLFMHIEKHGDYKLSMDVHDMYNYIIYSIVFILWVIWFEKLSDYKSGTDTNQR